MRDETTKLPTCFHLGVQRSGSTYLYNLLAQHPDICLPSIKESNFFSVNFDKGLDWYASLFMGGGLKIDTSAKNFMRGDIAAARIEDFLPSDVRPKFLLIFRNPIDYVFSHAQVHFNKGAFEAFPEIYPDGVEDFSQLIRRYPDYLERGRYLLNLQKNWLSRFDILDFKFICFEDFIVNTDRHLDEIMDFLEVPHVNCSTVATSRHKALRHPVLYRLSETMDGFPKAKRFFKKNQFVNLVYDVFLTRRTTRMDPSDRAYLREFFKDDVSGLRDVTGQRFDEWEDFG